MPRSDGSLGRSTTTHDTRTLVFREHTSRRNRVLLNERHRPVSPICLFHSPSPFLFNSLREDGFVRRLYHFPALPFVSNLLLPSGHSTTMLFTRIPLPDPTGAPAQVFATYELLEDILLHLPLQKLLLSQRVCHTFKDVVKSSSRIQQALFLQPACTRKVFWSTAASLSSGTEGSWRLCPKAGTVITPILNPFLDQ